MFSRQTMKAIETGRLTKSSRVEIISAMHDRILQIKPYPTPYEYMTVCQRLVDRFPTLQDKIGNGIVSNCVRVSVLITCLPCRVHGRSS